MNSARLLTRSYRLWKSGFTTLARAGTCCGTDPYTMSKRNTSGYSNSGTRRFENITAVLVTIGGVAAGYQFFVQLDKRKIKKPVEEEPTETAESPEQTPQKEDSETSSSSDSNESEAFQWHKTVRKDLPFFKMEDVQKHDSLENGVWVTYGIGVYDVTDFVPKHPGSLNIMVGAGSAIDPFWHVYQQHNTEPILKLLEKYRIGNINPEDDMGVSDLDDPWANEPKRHPMLKPAAQKPFNAEPSPSILVHSFITPTDFFYVRNHLPVPTIDVDTYELEVSVDGQEKELIFKLDDIKKLPKVTVTAAIMCGGNRRSEMNKVKEVKGLSWGPAAVGNAEWTGVRLCDVLKMLGVENDEVRHVIFEGYDHDPMSKPYAASIPLSKAMDERSDVLLAYEMNGKPLTRDHGFPVRVIVPGVVGARSVKWLGKIIVSENESNSHWQQNDYKGFSPSVDWDTVDFSKSPAIQHMPVTSAICEPSVNAKVAVEDGYITVRGYAWSGGGNRIVRVDLTSDEGKTWYTADLMQDDVRKAPSGRHWGWTLWTARIPVDKNANEVEIWSKAVDSNYNCQPEEFKNIWNLRGVLSNAYSKVKVTLDH